MIYVLQSENLWRLNTETKEWIELNLPEDEIKDYSVNLSFTKAKSCLVFIFKLLKQKSFLQ